MQLGNLSIWGLTETTEIQSLELMGYNEGKWKLEDLAYFFPWKYLDFYVKAFMIIDL